MNLLFVHNFDVSKFYLILLQLFLFCIMMSHRIVKFQDVEIF